VAHCHVDNFKKLQAWLSQQFLISNFLGVLNVVFFHLSDSPASEFYVPTFHNTVGSIFVVGGWNRQCPEMSAHKIQTPGNHPNERIQLSQELLIR